MSETVSEAAEAAVARLLRPDRSSVMTVLRAVESLMDKVKRGDALVIVREDGQWPEWVLARMAGGFINGPGVTAGENARDMLDALAAAQEGAGE